MCLQSLLEDYSIRYAGIHPAESLVNCLWVGSFILLTYGGVSERDFEIGRAFYFRSLRLQP